MRKVSPLLFKSQVMRLLLLGSVAQHAITTLWLLIIIIDLEIFVVIWCGWCFPMTHLEYKNGILNFYVFCLDLKVYFSRIQWRNKEDSTVVAAAAVRRNGGNTGTDSDFFKGAFSPQPVWRRARPRLPTVTPPLLCCVLAEFQGVVTL